MENQNVTNGFTKKIGRAVYKVNIHFNENSKESFNDKLFRIIQNDIANNAEAFNKTHPVPETAKSNTNLTIKNKSKIKTKRSITHE